MSRWRIGAVATVVVLAACSVLGKRSSEADPQAYVNREAHFSFLVPRGWQRQKSWRPFRKPPYLVRFAPSSGDAAATAASGPLEGRNCLDAGRGLIDSVSGATLTSAQAFAVKSAVAELAAARAETSSTDRRGMTKLFCEGDHVIVLEASANTAGYGERKAELEAILDSLSYLGAEGDVLVAAPKAASEGALSGEATTSKNLVDHPSKKPDRKRRPKARAAPKSEKRTGDQKDEADRERAGEAGAPETPPLPSVIGPR